MNLANTSNGGRCADDDYTFERTHKFICYDYKVKDGANNGTGWLIDETTQLF